MGLNAKQRLFVEEYLVCMNASEAARRAGYAPKWADRYGYKLRHRPAVEEAIAQRIAERAMDAAEVLARLAQQARGEQYRYLCEDGTVDLAGLIGSGLAHMVKGTHWDRNGNLTIEFYDAQSALVHIGKHLGLFTERVQQLNIDVSKLADEQLERIANGEEPLAVLATPGQGRTGTEAP